MRSRSSELPLSRCPPSPLPVNIGALGSPATSLPWIPQTPIPQAPQKNLHPHHRRFPNERAGVTAGEAADNAASVHAAGETLKARLTPSRVLENKIRTRVKETMWDMEERLRR